MNFTPLSNKIELLTTVVEAEIGTELNLVKVVFICPRRAQKKKSLIEIFSDEIILEFLPMLS